MIPPTDGYEKKEVCHTLWKTIMTENLTHIVKTKLNQKTCPQQNKPKVATTPEKPLLNKTPYNAKLAPGLQDPHFCSEWCKHPRCNNLIQTIYLIYLQTKHLTNDNTILTRHKYHTNHCLQTWQRHPHECKRKHNQRFRWRPQTPTCTIIHYPKSSIRRIHATRSTRSTKSFHLKWFYHSSI